MRKTRSTIGPVAALAAVGLTLAGCGGSSTSSTASSVSTPAAASSGGASGAAGSAAPAADGSAAGSAAASGPSTAAKDLKAAGCPSTVVIQTDWNPESEHGGAYQLLGSDYSINSGKKSVSGPLVDASGADTGVKVEIRAGGPAIGFQQVTAQMYSDKSITLGYVGTDEAIQNSAKHPTVAVLAPLEISPQMVMWDPKTYPDVKGIPDLTAKGVTTRVFSGSAWVSALEGKGVLKSNLVDGSYDGTPAAFVAAGGKKAQQGFASAEPYIYQHEVSAWGKPVKYQLTYDVGYQPYASAIAVRSSEVSSMSGCLKVLVPIMQQADVDYLKDPSRTNALVLKLVGKYNNGWVYSKGVADYSVQTQKQLGLVGNGPDSTHGNFDDARVQKLIDLVTPVFTAQKTAPKAGLKPSDVETNEFIDSSISAG
ncbi:hypothetical protein EV189_3077 [Motilibacter rhizosphaerae]|uniref:ABC-type nitrate/sulfonate/bicarbonate transport system substrate-binding protein n=1 Tax=Motilibacter rhizosphaerae TaxID=598652 RepID=A0A4Q7NFV5_9ACTN|nr:hypothetical protein [Motilibacter rhizosphaerae]RZS82682.1 hypothetical protein EV189_3077 [Motilibacter rhizosphaerae]